MRRKNGKHNLLALVHGKIGRIHINAVLKEGEAHLVDEVEVFTLYGERGAGLDACRAYRPDRYRPDGSELEFSYSAEESAISFVLPDNATDGAIVAVPASGVKVAVANIGMVVPTELAATPAEGIRGGQEIVISGVNMEPRSCRS